MAGGEREWVRGSGSVSHHAAERWGRGKGATWRGGEPAGGVSGRRANQNNLSMAGGEGNQ
jgi:hypothetical protein